MISAAEKDFIQAGCGHGIRFDGRDVTDFRHISIENSIFPHVNGSSRLRIGDGIVDILCSVKVEVAEPSTLHPNHGLFEVDVDISPSCNLKIDERRLLEQGSHIAQQLQRYVVGAGAAGGNDNGNGVESNPLDLKALCIIPGKYCWCVSVDLLILAMDGDSLDACSIAMYVALNCTKIPKIELFVGESGNMEDFEVCGDLGEAITLNAIHVPICVSSCKIAQVMVMDTTGYEQACASSTFAVAVNKKGLCCGFTKSLGGSFSPIDVATAQIHATTAATTIFQWIDECFSTTSTASINDRLYPDVPPTRYGLLA